MDRCLVAVATGAGGGNRPPKSYETLNFVDLVTSPPPPLAPGGGVGGVGKN